MISLLKRFGVFSPSFHPDPRLWGGVFGQACRAPALGKGSQGSSFLLNTLLHKLWARSYAGHGGPEGKASPPPQGAHLRRTDRHSHQHQNRECEEAQECAATNLPRKPRGARRRRAGTQSSIPVKLSPWPAEAPGTRIPLSPLPSPGRVQVRVPTRRLLFSALTTRRRAATCRNLSEGRADPEERLLSGTPASLGRPPTTCHTRSRLISLKAVNNFNP